MSDKLIDVVEAYLGKFKSSSKKTVARDLRPFVQWVGAGKALDEITSLDLLRYAGAKINCETCNGGQPYAQNTRRMKLKTIRIFFNWCEKHGLINDNPAKMLDIPPEANAQTREKAFDAAERRALIQYAAGLTPLSGLRPRDLALFLFCHDTGVRRGALAKMQRRDVDLDTRTAAVWNTKPKTGARRYTVHFGAYCAKALAAYLDTLPAGGDCYLWGTRNLCQPMSPDAISQVVGRACDAVGISRRSVHAFRHALAHRLVDDGNSINYVARVLDNTEAVAGHYYAPRDEAGAWGAALDVSYPDPDTKPGKVVRFERKKSG